MRLLTIHLIFLLSGAAGLGYQMAFVRMFSVGLGHEMPSVLAVVGAFFTGLALGAWVLDRPIARSARPGLWFVALEVVIGLWGLGCVWAVGPANELALQWMGVAPGPWRQWAVSLGVPLLVLLPGTAAMGATLAAMERFVAPRTASGRCIGGLYAVNTLGAVIGALGGAFVLIPALGYRATVMGLAGVDLLCAAMILPMVWPWRAAAVEPIATQRASPDADGGTGAGWAMVSRRKLLAIMFATGLLGIGYEIVGLRVVAQVIENTVYSYAAALAVFLIGTAGGAAAYQRWGWRAEPTRLLGYLLVGLAVTCLLGGVALGYSREVYQACRLALGEGLAAIWLSEMAVAALVFLAPTVLMGAAFSHLTDGLKRADGGVGEALAINTAGAALAPAMVGVVLMPLAGTKWTLAAVALAYLGLIPRLDRIAWPALLLPLVVLLALPANLRLVRTFEGQRVAAYREGVMASVAVVENEAGHRFLRVNNRFQMGGTSPASRRMELRQGHIPLMLHPDPNRALFLGAGTGVTALAGADHPELKIDAVELVPQVVAVMPAFAIDDRHLRRLPNAEVHTADARRFVRTTPNRYDVIVADLFHPARDGGGMLYTREHFEAVHDRLAAGGLFCQWLPLYQLDHQTLRMVVRTFLEVFPDARAIMADVNLNHPALGLVAMRGEWPRYRRGYLSRRAETPKLKAALTDTGLTSDAAMLGMLIGGPGDLAQYAGDGAINTDDRPIVMHRAPRFLARRDVTSYGRLLTLLAEFAPDATLWAGHGNDDFVNELQQWIERRDRFVQRAVESTN